MRYLISILSLVLVACHSEERYEGKSIFRYNVAEGISSLDPAFARSLDNVSACYHLFNGLVQSNASLEIKPSIAESWEILDSGRTYRFYLRDDVYFHKHPCFGSDSTRKVVAEDFIYSFNRLVDKKVLSPGKWVMDPVALGSYGVLKMQAVDQHTLEISLKEAFQPFLGILSMKYCSVVPREAVEHYKQEFRSNPVGTGPFQFKYWKENGKLIFLKNEHYFEKTNNGTALPKLDAIAISFIKDQEVAFLKFLSGDLDYMSGLKGAYKDELLNSKGELQKKYQSKIDFASAPYLNTEYLGFLVDPELTNTDHPLLNVWIRKAINYGFDRQKMLTYLRNGIGTAAEQGFIPQGLPAFTAEQTGYSYRPDSVWACLERAGYPKAKGLQEITLSTTAQYLDICEYLQSSLARFGIKLKVEVNQAATNNELIANGKVAFFRKSWVADYPDAENYLSLFKSANYAPSGPNYTHYSNATYDQWYEKAMRTSNDSMRYALYRKMDSCIIADVPVVPLFYDRVVRFSHPQVQGIGLNPMNHLDLKYVEKK